MVQSGCNPTYYGMLSFLGDPIASGAKQVVICSQSAVVAFGAEGTRCGQLNVLLLGSAFAHLHSCLSQRYHCHRTAGHGIRLAGFAFASYTHSHLHADLLLQAASCLQEE